MKEDKTNKSKIDKVIFHCQEVATSSKNLEKVIKNTHVFRQSFCSVKFPNSTGG